MSNEAQNWAWKVQGITPYEKVVLARLADHADGDHIAFPGKESIAKATCMNKRSVDRVIMRLESYGLIQIEHRHANDKRQRSNRYHLRLHHLQPIAQSIDTAKEENRPLAQGQGCSRTRGVPVPGGQNSHEDNGNGIGIASQVECGQNIHEKAGNLPTAPANLAQNSCAQVLAGCTDARGGSEPRVTHDEEEGVPAPGGGVAPCQGEGVPVPPESSLNHQLNPPEESSLSGEVKPKPKIPGNPRLVQPQPGGELPEGWVLSKAWAEMARAERTGITDEQIRITAANFRDYHLNLDGAERSCRDWPARWRRWVRAERLDRHPSADKASNGKPLALPRNDAELINFASQHGLPQAKPGESYPEYRLRLDRSISQGARA